MAQNNGCEVLDDIVNKVEEVHEGGTAVMKVCTEKDKDITSKRVLLCTGAFTAFRQLIPQGLIPNIDLVRQAVIFAELGQGDLKKMKNAPAGVFSLGTRTTNTKDKVGCYFLPPIKYPDGKVYLKLGHSAQFEKILHTEQEVHDWYSKPVPPEVQEGLKEILHTVFPDIKPLSYHCDACVTCTTPTRLPYIDMVRPKLGVLLGGNGYGAKASDQLGKLGADMILTGACGYGEFPATDFTCQWKKTAYSKL